MCLISFREIQDLFRLICLRNTQWVKSLVQRGGSGIYKVLNFLNLFTILVQQKVMKLDLYKLYL